MTRDASPVDSSSSTGGAIVDGAMGDASTAIGNLCLQSADRKYFSSLVRSPDYFAIAKNKQHLNGSSDGIPTILPASPRTTENILKRLVQKELRLPCTRLA
jgi:hypothetical protein